MTPAEAKRAILIHSGWLLDDAKAGLLDSLRPYRGIREEDFAEIVEAILVVHRETDGVERIEKEVVGALWDLCRRIRWLALEPGSGVRANRLASAEEIERLAAWVHAIESMTIQVLSNHETEACAAGFLEYVGGPLCVDAGRFANVADSIRACLDSEFPDTAEYAELAWAAVQKAGRTRRA